MDLCFDFLAAFGMAAGFLAGIVLFGLAVTWLLFRLEKGTDNEGKPNQIGKKR